MKYRPVALITVATLACLLVSTAVFGQTTYTWTGGGDGTNFDSAANYGGTLPATASSDICSFNGTVTGNLSLNYSIGNFASGPGSSGISIQLTASQTGNVAIDNLSANLNPPNLAIYDIQIQNGAGAFSWGANGRRANNAARPSGAVHSWANNSTNPATIGSNIVYVAGGGTAYTMAFGGSGDWLVHSQLQPNNGSSIIMTKNGTGTMTWNPVGHVGGDQITAVNINDGTLILTAPHSKLNIRPIANVGTFIFNAPAQAQLLSGIISGTGELRVNAGTLTLGGASTYSGNTVLNGGGIIINSLENVGVSGPLGNGGTISFNGGTLQFSVNNTFDYSPRFSTAAGQAISIDTAGQEVTFASALTSSEGTLTKLGSGTLILSGANTYNGLTTVSLGKLVFQGSTGTGIITVTNGAALGVTGGVQIQPNTLTVGTSGSVTLEFNNVTSTATPLIAAGTISAGGPITINVNGGTFAVGQNYPLFSWTSGAAPAVNLGAVFGASGTLNTNGNTIWLNVTALALKWTGTTSGNWTAPNNWTQNGIPTTYFNPAPALFDDSASGTTAVIVDAPVLPEGVTVNNSAKSYSIASSSGNDIGGSTGLTKTGAGMLTLSGGAHTYTGVTMVNGNGTLSVSTLADGGTASDLGAAGGAATDLVLDGGTLQYTGGAAAINRLFTIGTGGGLIDASGSGALNLNNPGAIGLVGSGTRTLIVKGSNSGNNALAAALGDAGGPTALNKSGAGKWILTGTNAYSGGTTISGGTLQIGAGGASGSLGSGNVVNNGSLRFNRTGILTVDGGISGTGAVTNDGNGTVILNGTNSFLGGTYINAGTLQFGNGGPGGSVGNAPVVMTNGSTVVFNSTTPVNIVGFGNDVSGAGNMIVRSGADVTLGDGNTPHYTGWTLIEAGATFQPCTGNTGGGFFTPGFSSSSITNTGTLKMISQNAPPLFGISNNIVGTGRVWIDTRNSNAGWVMLGGNNTYTGGTFIGAGGIVIGDGLTVGKGSIVGSVIFTNTTGPFISFFNTSKRVVFARPDAFTFTNDLISAVSDGSTVANQGSVEQQLGMVILTGNNSYPGDTMVLAGATLQSGNGGTGGSIGSGDKFINGTLIYNRSANDTVTGVVSGTGALIKMGPGTLTLTNRNSFYTFFTGATTVSNGTLLVNGQIAGAVSVQGGILGGSGIIGGAVTTASGSTLAPGASVGTLTISNNLIIGGDLAIEVNKSLAHSNDFVFVSGTLSNTGTGILTVSNLGPVLQVGDKFTLFSKPLQNGALVTVTGAGVQWTNNLAVDGSIAVVLPTLGMTKTGDNLQFTWGGSFKLQVQINNLTAGLSTNWADYPDGGTSPVSMPMNVTNQTVFFRLISTP
jgi:fibronectin-binding autotransporter adhesin